jgi:hypothetical protein
MGDPGFSSLSAIPRSSTAPAQTEILWLVATLLLSALRRCPSSALDVYAGTPKGHA